MYILFAFLLQRHIYLNLPRKLGSCQVFTMKQLRFCNFDIKNEFLDPQNPRVAYFRLRIAPEMELQHYFQN